MPLSHEAVIAQMSDIRKNVGLPVSVQDVVSALQSGEEVFIPLPVSSFIPLMYFWSGDRHHQDAMCVL
jgi:hypothetical protein